MSRKRKTRREKIIAASRRSSLDYFFETQVPNIHIEKIVGETKNPAQTTAALYTYVVKDVRYTLFATSLIAVINIVLFIALKFKYVRFFGIEF